jgi:OFA family oxalate/formate antiporter-like MFS transporter
MQYSLDFNAAKAAQIVALYNLANFAGRLFWGFLSDKIGRTLSLLIISCCMGISMVALWLFHVPTVYIPAALLVALSYGGTAAMLPPLTADVFGSKHINDNYSTMYVVYGVAGMIGSPLAAIMWDLTGSYNLAFISAAGCSLIAILLAFTIFRIIAPARKAAKLQQV